MPRLPRGVCIVILIAGLHISAGTAAGQTNVYVAGGAFADVKRFDTATYIYQDTQNATALGGSLRIGTFATPRWSLELALDASQSTATKQDDVTILSVYPPIPSRDVTPTNQFTSVGVLVGFHPAVSGRIRPGYLGGVSFLRGKYESSLYLPLYDTSALNGLPITVVSQPTPLYAPKVTDVRYTTGVTLGIEAAIDLSKHFAVVPEMRVVTLSNPAGLLLRPGVSVRWSH